IRAEAHTYYPHRKLLRWPLWWIGVLFFAYVLIQALNPAWEFVQRDNGWAMRHLPDHITWLPTGMTTPFTMMNGWRQMIIWGAPFLLSCALWIGLTRRKAVITLLTAIVVNAAILAIAGIAVRTSAPETFLWFAEGRGDYSFASFVYKNHAGSFFALVAGLAVTLAIYTHQRAVRRNRRSSPASLLILAAMILSIAVLLSYSRAAIILLGAFFGLIMIVGLVLVLFRGGLSRAPFAIAAFTLTVVAFGLLAGQLVNSEKTIDRFVRITDAANTDRSIITRSSAWQAGLDMASEHPAFGWGAGGFRFLFPRYQRTRPEITWHIHPSGARQYAFWENIHNDYLQAYIELGRTGLILLFSGAAFACASFLRSRGIRHVPALTLAGATGISLAHAAVDFPLQNPAILVTLATALCLALALPYLDPR
ncbi:MAG: O-antigen ligase family protein, partial [Rhodanobacter sp.]